jgi:glycosyltransferase involved in cell wall biosynthesis
VRERENIRVLVVSLSTYSPPYNDGKLHALGQLVENVTAVAGDGSTMWGAPKGGRVGDGFRVHILNVRYGRSNALGRLRQLDAIADQVRPTVIHVECEPWQGVAVQAVKLAGMLGVPVGVQFAENGPRLQGAGGAFRRLIGRRTLGACSYAVGWSIESTKIAEDLAPAIRSATYPGTGVTIEDGAWSGTGERWFGADAESCGKIAFVGRFAPEKGLDEFMKIADRLADRIPLRVAIAGGSDQDPTVSEWLSVRPWARAHGVLRRPRVFELLAAADVLVCPSRTTRLVKEQFGKGPVEAMAMGTPVFAYGCGALPEVIAEGGVVVEEGAADLLAAELEEYLRSPTAARAKLAAHARAQASQFTDQALAAGLVDIWTDVLRESVPGRSR